MRRRTTTLLFIVLACTVPLLSACGSGPALASEAAATAQAQGCWPDSGFGTPLPGHGHGNRRADHDPNPDWWHARPDPHATRNDDGLASLYAVARRNPGGMADQPAD